MTNLVTWTDYPTGGLEALEGHSDQHRYYAARVGEYGLNCFPWLLTRDDGWQTRVTNTRWVKELAEMCEQDVRHLHMFMTNVSSKKRHRKEELQAKRSQS